MKTEVRIRGRQRFHHDVWRVLINGHKWLYDHTHDCFIEKTDGQVVAKEDMPTPVQLGFTIAWEWKRNRCSFSERYSHRHSYGWKLRIGNLQAKGRDVVVFSRGRRMGVLQLVDNTDNPLKKIPTLPVLV